MLKISNNTWFILDDLNFNSINKISSKYKKLLKDISTNEWNIDFSSSKYIDSAGLALIIEFIKYSNKHNIELNLINLNIDVLKLANIHGVDKIIINYIK